MPEPLTEALAGQLDQLSLKAMAGGASAAELIEGLRAIEASARQAGAAGAAQLARELASRASAAGVEAEQVVASGLENLRRAIEAAGAGVEPAAPQSIAQDPELIGDFVNEAREHLETIEAQVLLLESEPTSRDPLDAAFRSFHTIKGLAGFLDLSDIREVAHEVETLLDRARNHEIDVTASVVDVVLASADYLKRAIAWVEDRLGGGSGAAPATAGLLSRVRGVLGEEPHAEPVGDADKVDKTIQGGNTPAEPQALQARAAEMSLTLRVDASKLDQMVDMVGELVIAQSMVTHSPEIERVESGPLQRRFQQLGRITGEVQRLAMSMRMTPVAQLFSRMNRLTRDLARKNGKKVRLELRGEETELDKTIIELLADPLMHMVRNSLDHGLEGPDERVANGKPPEGRLLLAAAHQAGSIVIEVSDDGRGLNTAKILKKARERGLVSEGQNLSENEIFHLVFEPGFSTAEQVTDVSGRGVGMDVVRRQIQSLRGRIDIQSAVGRGATFLLRLPLTLAIIDGLVVKVGAERYILPIASVREMLRPNREMIFTMEGRAEMAMVRGEMLPIVRLGRRFGVAGAVENPAEALFVVIETESRRYCLLVDHMLGKQEVVIKSLGDAFRDVAGVSGGAILGDGRVGLILDMMGVFRETVNV